MTWEIHYKVVDENLLSLCIDGNTKSIQYKIDEWVQEPQPQSGDGHEGGIWTFANLCDAKWLAGYVKKHPNPDLRRKPRIFKAEVRSIIAKKYRKNGRLYTIKSCEVKLVEELFPILNGKYHNAKQRARYA